MSWTIRKTLANFTANKWLAVADRALLIAALRDPDQAQTALYLLGHAPLSTQMNACGFMTLP